MSIAGVTIQNGQSLAAGGGIASDGSLTLSNSRVSGNAAPITQDQRGIARPQDGDANQVAQCDIGAYDLGTPAKASLRKPSDGASGVATMVRLKWSATPGAIDYHLQLRSGCTTGTLVLDTTTPRTKRRTPLLTHGTTYFWHVRACDDIGCGGYSAYRSFKVAQ